MAVKLRAVNDAPSVRTGSEVTMNRKLRIITSASFVRPRIRSESAENSVFNDRSSGSVFRKGVSGFPVRTGGPRFRENATYKEAGTLRRFQETVKWSSGPGGPAHECTGPPVGGS